eukprot:CAMPEP_0171306076 /NCGR_PEP_ID=MMETSP0816-20121228/16014_1 /TAXON_ID=420281 /ORGANISM="Proboscia inermis, Strain CCAP1064/1" /LENGTH=39 /DNA_ID= /DNA_START= /DNA_END= /DNA_ORIENTATION=
MPLIQQRICDLIQAIHHGRSRHDLIHIPPNVSGEQCPGS